MIEALEKEKENGRLKAEEEGKKRNHHLKRKKMIAIQDHLISNKKRARKYV